VLEKIDYIAEMILIDRTWSWSIIGMLYLGLTLIIRNWFMSSIIKRAKELKGRWFQDIKDLYLKRALAGWILYLISFAIILLLWIRPDFLPLTPVDWFSLVLAMITYFISVLLHVQALGVAAVVTMRRLESK
jgi:hypothetical protein